MYTHLNRGDPEIARLLNAIDPHLAWALILAAAVYLYVAITPRPHRGTT